MCAALVPGYSGGWHRTSGLAHSQVTVVLGLLRRQGSGGIEPVRVTNRGTVRLLSAVSGLLSDPCAPRAGVAECRLRPLISRPAHAPALSLIAFSFFLAHTT